MRRLLDTNAYSALKRGSVEAIALIQETEHLYMSAVVIGELIAGFRSGLRAQENLRDLRDFLAAGPVEFLPVTLTTADRFGRVSSDLRRAGTPIPTNDIWIAAHAFEKGAELISYDQHFKVVPGLAWLDPSTG